MKKIIKNALLISLIATLLIILTGCGQDKLEATRNSDFYGAYYTVKHEVTFKQEKANKLLSIYEFNNTSDADNFYEFWNLLDKSKANTGKNKITQKGTKVTMEGPFTDFDTEIKGKSKEIVKSDFESKGYTVK